MTLLQTACITSWVLTWHITASVAFLQDMAQRNIVVKSFTDVPMADVEMIFPEKKVFIKPFVLIQLVVTVVLAAITVFSTLFQVRSPCILIAG